MKQLKEEKVKSRLQLLIRIVVSTRLMYWLITMIDWEEALQTMKGGSPFYFVAAFFAIQITVVGVSGNGKCLLSPLKNKEQSLSGIINSFREVVLYWIIL